MAFLDPFLEGLKLAASMAWETWWALVLGFTIAGAVESFVSEEKMSRVLGGGGLKPILLGTLFGAASSSCSFGAVATTKSLFKKGASAEASLGAFQFASTNLVIELGLVMWVLLGWQFVVANVISGLILIALLVVIFRLLIPKSWFDAAREHVKKSEGVRDPQCGMEVDPDADDVVTLEAENGETLYFCSNRCRETFQQKGDEETFSDRLLTERGWLNAFRNALGEWQMLWKDIVIGFLVAGLIAAFVPRHWWSSLFAFGSTPDFLGVVASSLLGVSIGVITFVCSVGNVPFALILWKNGIAFGGVMAFIFADLIVPTIVHAYRRYYGWRMALTLFVTIFFTATVAGVIIHYLWQWFELAPPAGRPGGTAPKGYTVYLNLAFTALFALQLYLARFRKQDQDD
jgi:uncharacterized membrane protein YraQ (UPF0718 family)